MNSMEYFDPESGQMFRETIVRPTKYTPWQQRCVGERPRYVPPMRGAESLQEVALRKIIFNAQDLTPAVLETLPSAIVHRIWKAVRRKSVTDWITTQLIVLT